MSIILITYINDVSESMKIEQPRFALLTFSCENFFISLISRKMRFASTGSSKALDIFLIATFSPVSLSKAEMTTPYAP